LRPRRQGQAHRFGGDHDLPGERELVGGPGVVAPAGADFAVSLVVAVASPVAEDVEGPRIAVLAGQGRGGVCPLVVEEDPALIAGSRVVDTVELDVRPGELDV